jgi:prepilin-type N-terminal cleavage/methylation domain-containing protein
VEQVLRLTFPGTDRMTKPIDNANGFTLLELILSLVIIGFIVGISLGAIRLGIATQETGTQRAETFQRLRIIGEHLSEKIKSSYPVFISASQSLDFPDRSQSQRILAFEGGKESIRFVTFSSPISSPNEIVWAHEVKFYLGKHPQTGETGIIMMEKDISDGDIFSSSSGTKDKGRYFLLAKNVSHLKFRYYQLEKEITKVPGATTDTLSYTGKWVDKISFNSEPKAVSPNKNLQGKDSPLTLPKGVEISLGLLEPADAEKKKEPKLITSPPIHLLLHSGMEFKLPPEEVKNEDDID